MRLLPPRGGTVVAVALLALSLAPAAAAEAEAPEWIEADHVLVFEDLETFVVTGTLRVHRLTHEGERYDADEIRTAYRQIHAARGADAAEAFVDDVGVLFTRGLARNLELAFPGSEVEAAPAEVVRASLEAPPGGSPWEPPVEVRVSARVRVDLAGYGLEGVSTEDVTALLDAGASLEVPVALFADAGHRNVFDVRFPDGLLVSGERSARAEVDNLRGLRPVVEDATFLVSSAEAASADRNLGRAELTIDIQDIDVSLAQAAGGDFGEMLVQVRTRLLLDAVELPRDAHVDLPDAVHMEGLTADGLRTLAERGLVGRDRIEGAANDLRRTLARRIVAAFGAEPEALRGAWVESSLAPSAGASEPLVFEATATVRRPVSPQGPPDRGAALALYTFPTRIPLERVEGLETTYVIVLPPGLTVRAADTRTGDTDTRLREDGREEILVRLDGDDGADTAVMTAQIAVTPSFVAAKFGALVAVVALVALAAVVLVGWKVARAFRKR